MCSRFGGESRLGRAVLVDAYIGAKRRRQRPLQGRDPRQEAGQDKSIAKRLQKNPDSADARLDNGLDESMDGSDPISATQPGSGSEPAKSSGYDEEAERALREKQA